MKKSRILYGIWLLVWIFIWVAGQNQTAAFVAAASILCEAAEIAISRFICRNLSAEIQCSPSLQKNTEMQIFLNMRNRTPFSCSKGECMISCENLLTGEKDIICIPFALPGRSEGVVQERISFPHCGKVLLTVVETRCYDVFGIYRAKLSTGCGAASLVLPQLYPTNLSITPGQVTDIESDEYSGYKAGFDASETYALRDYKQGDSMKQIHWKLSGKADELIVREFSLPIKNSLLILMDNTRQPSEQGSAVCAQTEIAEAMGEIAISLSMELCEQGYEHHIAWVNHERNAMEHREIDSEEALNAAMPDILSAGIREDAAGALARMEQAKVEYAHTILLTAEYDGATELLMPEAKISILDVREYMKFRENGIYAEV